MTHIEYTHSTNASILSGIGRVTRWAVSRLASLPQVVSSLGSVGRRILVGLLWLVGLLVQGACILLVAGLIEAIHALMSLYLDLAQMQLDLTSIYVAATTPAK